MPVRTPLADTVGSRLANPPLLVPVLRAGLGMVEQAHALIPEAQVGFVGVARDEETAPAHALSGVAARRPERRSPVMVLDPMLATGGSMAHTLELLYARNAVDITAGLRGRCTGRHCGTGEGGAGVRLFTAAIDDGLNDVAYIVPGLGDAGDRQFGPR